MKSIKPELHHHAQQEQQGCHGESDWKPISELLVLVTQQVAVICVEGLMPFLFYFSFLWRDRQKMKNDTLERHCNYSLIESLIASDSIIS